MKYEMISRASDGEVSIELRSVFSSRPDITAEMATDNITQAFRKIYGDAPTEVASCLFPYHDEDEDTDD